MKKILLICAALMAISAPLFAAGLDLTWSKCQVSGGVGDWPLGTSTGFLYGQVTPASTVPGFTNCDFIVTLQTDSSPAGPRVPFYDLNEGNTNPTGCNTAWATRDSDAPTNCPGAFSPWDDPDNAPVGGDFATSIAGFTPQVGAAHRGRIKGTVFLPPARAVTLAAGAKLYGFSLRFLSSGAGCLGGTTPTLWEFNEASLGSLSAASGIEAAPIIIINPNVDNNVTGNGGGTIPGGATPTRNQSWGALKSLYR